MLNPSSMPSYAEAAAASGTATTRLALAWPYSGGNLGDAAIIGAAMGNLRAAIAPKEIVGITLDPKGTLQRHGMTGTRLCAATMAFYGSGRWDLESADQYSPTVFRLIKRVLRKARAKLAFVVREAGHWVYALKFARGVDVIIFPGSGQFDEEFGGPWGHPYAMFKWSLAARLTGGKVAIMSVGVCHLDAPLSRWFSKRTLRLANYVSLRDPWSCDFAHEQLHEPRPLLVPDLAFSLPVPQEDGPLPPSTGALRIGVSPMPYAHPEMWPRPDAPVYENYLNVMCGFVSGLLAAGHAVTLFNTDSPDMRVAEAMLQRLQQSETPQALAHLTNVPATELSQVLDLYHRLDVVVASRLHGVILGHVCGRPVLAVSYDRKVTTHMSQMDQSDACVEIRGLELPSLALAFERMRPKLDSLALQVRRTRDSWRAAVVNQYQDVAALISRA